VSEEAAGIGVEELRRRREDIVREHMESENRHQFDVTWRPSTTPATS
jgi:hypothetical protein